MLDFNYQDHACETTPIIVCQICCCDSIVLQSDMAWIMCTSCALFDYSTQIAWIMCTSCAFFGYSNQMAWIMCTSCAFFGYSNQTWHGSCAPHVLSLATATRDGMDHVHLMCFLWLQQPDMACIMCTSCAFFGHVLASLFKNLTFCVIYITLKKVLPKHAS